MSNALLFILAIVTGITIGYLAVKNHWKIVKLF